MKSEEEILTRQQFLMQEMKAKSETDTFNILKRQYNILSWARNKTKKQILDKLQFLLDEMIIYKNDTNYFYELEIIGNTLIWILKDDNIEGEKENDNK